MQVGKNTDCTGQFKMSFIIEKQITNASEKHTQNKTNGMPATKHTHICTQTKASKISRKTTKTTTTTTTTTKPHTHTHTHKKALTKKSNPEVSKLQKQIQ